jgi:dipeptidase E
MKFFAIGGGHNGGEFDKELEEKIRSNIDSDFPKVVFVPYASEDFLENYHEFIQIYQTLGCQVALLEPGKENLLIQADLIYFGRGSTILLVEKLNETRAISFIQQAILNGTILAGFSAGAHALFTIAGSYEKDIGYTLVEGLGFIKGCIMTHYNYEERAEAYHSMLEERRIKGIGLEDHTMLIVEDGIATLYTTKEQSNAYFIQGVQSIPHRWPIKGEQIIVPF